MDGPASGEKGSKGGPYKYCNDRTWMNFHTRTRSSQLTSLKRLPRLEARYTVRCRAKLEQTSQSRPDSGLGLSQFQYLIDLVEEAPALQASRQYYETYIPYSGRGCVKSLRSS